MSTILYPDGRREEVSPANGKSFTLAELQAIVGGRIEPLYTRDDDLMIINANGKFEDLPLNVQATALMGFPSLAERQRIRDEHPEVIFIGSVDEPDYIAGTVLLYDHHEVR